MAFQEGRPLGFFTDTSICIGCKACEVACKQWNQLPADGYELTGDSYDNTKQLSGTTWRHVAFIENPKKRRLTGDVDLVALAEDVTEPLPGGAELDALGRWAFMSDVCKHCVEAPFIHCSTNKVYGDRPNTLPLIETDTRWELPEDQDSPGILARLRELAGPETRSQHAGQDGAQIIAGHRDDRSRADEERAGRADDVPAVRQQHPAAARHAGIRRARRTGAARRQTAPRSRAPDACRARARSPDA